ncbi:type II toxin-antitoxin system PemK/MazF family toxin [candidate division KSB1 bacterium]|nr:type II toxin-antitoxin system PemK/MazF family toxin [candidate division KSB1 bacterium]MBL7094787.1 type II toxin-antitoxin system PemK/MazF family toxin [candidate division KSB1 bacterium]
MAHKIVKRGSIVLIRYPFTDLTNSRIRPALILTPDEFLNKINDVLCLFISSQEPLELLKTDYVLEISHPLFPLTGLKFQSVFRTHKLALLQKALVTRVLGELGGDLMLEINKRLKIALGL